MTQAKTKAEEMVKEMEERRDAERRLNEAFALIFKGPTGELVLNYLLAKTMNTVSGPHTEANALFHLEGQRFIMADIKQRIRNGEEKTL